MLFFSVLLTIWTLRIKFELQVGSNTSYQPQNTLFDFAQSYSIPPILYNELAAPTEHLFLFSIIVLLY